MPSTHRADAAFALAAHRYESATPPDDDDRPLHERVDCTRAELPEVLRAVAEEWRAGRAAALPHGVRLNLGVAGRVWWSLAAVIGSVSVRDERDDAHADDLAIDTVLALADEVERMARR